MNDTGEYRAAPIITTTSESPLTPAELAGLEGMDAEGLRGLLRKVYSAGWGGDGLTGSELIEAALQTDDEAYDSLMLRARVLAKNAKHWKEFETLARFWVEQTKGKPLQRQATLLGITGAQSFADILASIENDESHELLK